MKNKLIDLNNHLYAQIERLSDEDLKGEALKQELARSKAVASVAREIISTGQLVLDAQKAYTDGLVKTVPPMLESKTE